MCNIFIEYAVKIYKVSYVYMALLIISKSNVTILLFWYTRAVFMTNHFVRNKYNKHCFFFTHKKYVPQIPYLS